MGVFNSINDMMYSVLCRDVIFFDCEDQRLVDQRSVSKENAGLALLRCRMFGEHSSCLFSTTIRPRCLYIVIMPRERCLH